MWAQLLPECTMFIILERYNIFTWIVVMSRVLLWFSVIWCTHWPTWEWHNNLAVRNCCAENRYKGTGQPMALDLDLQGLASRADAMCLRSAFDRLPEILHTLSIYVSASLLSPSLVYLSFNQTKQKINFSQYFKCRWEKLSINITIPYRPRSFSRHICLSGSIGVHSRAWRLRMMLHDGRRRAMTRWVTLLSRVETKRHCVPGCFSCWAGNKTCACVGHLYRGYVFRICFHWFLSPFFAHLLSFCWRVLEYWNLPRREAHKTKVAHSIELTQQSQPQVFLVKMEKWHVQCLD